VWRASNLTPSALGKWTKAEIIAAIRDGVRPDGTRLAPIMPYATDEVWSWWHQESIHRASWPRVDEIEVDGDPRLLGDIAAALVEIRGAKSQAKVSMKTEVTAAHISGSPEALDRLRTVEADLRAVGRITGELTWREADAPLTIEITLSASTPSA